MGSRAVGVRNFILQLQFFKKDHTIKNGCDKKLKPMVFEEQLQHQHELQYQNQHKQRHIKMIVKKM